MAAAIPNHRYVESPGETRRARIGPDDQGRRMSLRDFTRAEATPGFHYELERGVIQVTDVPGMPHGLLRQQLELMLRNYQLIHPDVIYFQASGVAAKIELWGRESERHPDWSIYLRPHPAGIDQPWDHWIPDIVIEIVSRSSSQRDYVTKVDDYLAAGVREYWIIDPQKKAATILIRHADAWEEKRLGPRGKYKPTLLTGFVLDLSRLLQAPPRPRKSKKK